jgi:hypothetical protein
LILQIAACAAPRATPSPRGAASVAGTAPAVSQGHTTAVPSRFRVAVREAAPASNRGRGAEPCAVRGRTFICVDDVPLAADDDGVHTDRALEHAASAPATPVVGELRKLRGRWPDDAWLLTATRADNATSETRSHAYQWNGDHWAQRAEWLGQAYATAPFEGGMFVEGVRHHDEDVREHSPLAYIVGSTEGRRPVSPILPLWTFNDDEVQDLLGVDGTVFLMGPAPKTGHLLIQRMSPGAARDRVDELSTHDSQARLWAKTSRDVVAFGGPRDADEQPLLEHFDGDAWSRIEAPPGVDIVVAYGRTDDGTERAFAFRGAVLSFWERVQGARWTSVALPAVAQGESIDGHWVTDDDAWVHIAAYPHAGRLLRMHPVKYVAQLGDGAPTLVPVQGDDRVPAAVPAVPPPPPPDPSPFHDAVISYPDRDDAERPNGLEVCPLRGRTWICGVSRVPLVSTDDGVVPSDSRTTAPPKDLENARPTRALRPPTDLPPGTTRVAAYDRTSHATERLFAYAGDTLSLVERPINAALHATGPWRAIILPTLPDGDRIHAVWLANDDAWLLVWPKDTTKNPPHLMRMQPVKKVWTYPRARPSLLGW